MKLVRSVLAACTLALAPLLALAADPAPLRLVVGFAPGGGTDGAARLVADKLASELGQGVIVENRAGAGGTIGALSVMRAPADGQTVFFGTGAEMLINPITRKTPPYDVLKDFVPVVDVGGVSFVLIVPAESPVASLRSLVDKARAAPGQLNFASFGVGSTNHLLGELFLSAGGAMATHVPYQGSAPAMTALLGGQVDFAFETLAVALPHIRSGKLRALATPSPQRLRDLADVPTLEESGFPGLAVEGWMGVFAPPSTPAAAVQRINAAMNRVLQRSDIAAAFIDRGVRTAGGTPDEFRHRLAQESQRWRRVVRDAHIELQ
jgi:tripartite-type tricarboxylate transporter receptor subunit TctC